MTTHGFFPFGQPNESRPVRRPAGAAKVLVVGVYPSAFHVAWTAPPQLDRRPAAERKRPTIASLAVDVEPVVFWDGHDPSPADVLDKWRAAVAFRDEWGSVALGTNGPSGEALNDTLELLGYRSSEAAFTDAVPWFLVKRDARSQGQAIDERFNPVARQMGAVPGDLPTRPTTSRLVGLVSSEPRRTTLRTEMIEANAPLVVTLGQEALDAVASITDECVSVQPRLEPTELYGSRGRLRIDSFQAELLPLVHPGFERQTKDARWTERLKRWKSTAKSS